MGDAAKKLLDDVLALPEEERVELAYRALESVDPLADPEWERSWLAELRQRSRDLETKGQTLSWETMRARVVAKLPPRT
jgi:putative addiction module component (TIGR02574 family)